MKRWLFSCVVVGLLSICPFFGYAQVWFEDFQGEAAGANSGTGSPSGNWTTSCVGCNGAGFGNNNYVWEVFELGGAQYYQAGRTAFGGGDGTGAEGVWTSPDINIAAFRDLAIYIETGSLNTNAGDYLNVYYQLNTGSGFQAPQLFHTQPTGSSTTQGISATLNGTQIRIIVRGFTSDNFEYFTFDNIAVTNTLYSRITPADWNAAGTWSALSIGGATCACTPNQYTRVVIGGGHTVRIVSASSAAGVQINGTADVGGAGTLTYNGDFDLNVEQGGPVSVAAGGTINAGVNADASLTFSDNVSKAFTVNGTVTLGDLNVTNSSIGNGTVITISGTSTLTITDDLNISESSFQSAAITNNLPLANVINIGGTVTINNTSVFTNNGGVTISNNAAGTLTGSGTWTQGTNSALNYAGLTMTITTLNASATGNLVTYNRAGNQTIFNPAGGVYYDLTIAGAGSATKSSSGNHIITNDLIVSGSNIFNVDAGNDNISIGGDWTITSLNADPFVQGTETVTFNGSGTQVISTALAAGESFNNLVFNHTGTVRLDDNISVAAVLTMSNSGVINLNNATLSLTSNAAGALVHNLTSTNGWMYGGTFSRARPGSTTIAAAVAHGLFPMGSASNWRPLFIGQTTSVAGTAGTLTVTYTNSATTTTTNPATFGEGIVRRHDGFWDINNPAGITAGTYTLQGGGTGFTVTNSGHLRLSTATGVVGTHGAGSGGPTDWRANRTALTPAHITGNNFHLASTNVASSLPIELIHFTATVLPDGVKLDWATAQEINNNYFTIEKTTDFESFTDVQKIPGKGNTREHNEYSTTDHAPFIGRSYYRLKQTDYDGQFTYSDPVMVEVEEIVQPMLSIFPVPSNGQTIGLELRGIPDNTFVEVQVLNVQGVVIHQETLDLPSAGIIRKDIVPNSPLTPGLYIIRAGKTRDLIRKISVE